MRSRAGSAGVFVLTWAGFGVAWGLELWLIVVATSAIATALMVSDLLARRRSACQAAVWALHAPRREADHSVLERTLAAFLAASAAASTELLEASAEHAETTIPDPWLRYLALERIGLARTLLDAQRLPPPPRLLTRFAARTTSVIAVVAATASLAVAAATREALFLVPLGVARTTFVIVHGEVRLRTVLPPDLCRAASTPPLPGRTATRETAVVAALADLAGRRRRILDSAGFLVRRGAAEESSRALARLAAARELCGGRRRPPLAGVIAGWAVGAAAVAGAIEVLT